MVSAEENSNYFNRPQHLKEVLFDINSYNEVSKKAKGNLGFFFRRKQNELDIDLFLKTVGIARFGKSDKEKAKLKIYFGLMFQK